MQAALPGIVPSPLLYKQGYTAPGYNGVAVLTRARSQILEIELIGGWLGNNLHKDEVFRRWGKELLHLHHPDQANLSQEI